MTRLEESIAPESSSEPLRIWWNRNLQGKISPGKLAAHAAHAALAALAAYGIVYTHPIVVLAASKGRVESMPISIRDAGHTELAPDTVTTGVERPRIPFVPQADADAVRATASEALVSASDEGYWLMEDAKFRRNDAGQLVADVYDDGGAVTASYAIQITVGERVDA